MSCMNQKATQDVAAMPATSRIGRQASAFDSTLPGAAGHRTSCTSNKMQTATPYPSTTLMTDQAATNYSATTASTHGANYAAHEYIVQGRHIESSREHKLVHINAAPTHEFVRSYEAPTEWSNSVLVAVNAAKLNRHALEWALTNVVQPADRVTLLALWPAGGRTLNWSLPLISRDCSRRAIARKGNGKMADVEEEVNDCCSCMMQELRTLCDTKKATVKVKVALDAARGTIAAEAEKAGATWVVLDKHVMSTREGKVCMEQLQCNVVLVKQAKSSKILRLNLKRSSHCQAKANQKASDHQHVDSELPRTLSYHEKPWPDTNIKSSPDLGAVYNDTRRGRAKKKAKRKADHRIKHTVSFYDSADEHYSASSPETVHISARTAPFTTKSDTADNFYIGARDEAYYNVGAVCGVDQLRLDSDQEDGSVSDYGELDFFVNSSELATMSSTCTGGHDEQLHSAILCSPASSCSTASHSLQDPNSELQTPLTVREGFEHSPCDGQHTDWFHNIVEGFYACKGPSPPRKLVPTTFTCRSSGSKPNSASTTPKSETLTLTGSTYPKASRSPSPAVPSNQHKPPALSSSSSIQHAPRASQDACINIARASRSPSPSSKSNCAMSPPDSSTVASALKLSSSLSPSSACPSTLWTCTRTNPRSRQSPVLTSAAPTNGFRESPCPDFVSSLRKQETPASTLTEHPCPTTEHPCPTANSSSSGIARSSTSDKAITTRELMQRFAEWDHQGSRPSSAVSAQLSSGSFRKAYTDVKTIADVNIELEKIVLTGLERTSSVRREMSKLGGNAEDLFRHPAPPGPPPLCSICQHKAPVFGKPPRRFSYTELEMATRGFSMASFLAEGGFGSVHRGVLPDGQVVAVKQHKLASSQGDIEFCSEVEVLSCAQHRNVVMLIGYCIDDSKRLLVYEFICNGSLDSHLYGSEENPLPWSARQKVAIGAARGLRYLHEECRIGCIIHRDVRPNNILLTHDYEPMVGDFGLARWQPDGDFGVQTRVIGTFGYLAPEYAQSGEVTEKADVYSFGVVLLELVTGRKAVELARPKGQQCLTEWARPLLEEGADMDELLDPRLQAIDEHELFCTLHAASLCIRKDPHQRPRMSQVLRILEGDVVIDHSGPSTPLDFNRPSKLYHQPASLGSFNGSRSGRIFSSQPAGGVTQVPSGSLSPPLIGYSGSRLDRAGEISPGHSVLTRRRSDAFPYDTGSLYYHAASALRSRSDTYSKRFSFTASHY